MKEKMPQPHTLFNAAKLMQTDINAWMACGYARCLERQVCLGGPRGTCARTGGWPLCTPEGNARLQTVKQGQIWQRSEIYDRETPIQRVIRRNEEQVNAMKSQSTRAQIQRLIDSG